MARANSLRASSSMKRPKTLSHTLDHARSWVQRASAIARSDGPGRSGSMPAAEPPMVSRSCSLTSRPSAAVCIRLQCSLRLPYMSSAPVVPQSERMSVALMRCAPEKQTTKICP
eukprot:scaffold43391_cov65-Phaeocystis_antarctica.AAC.3